MMVAQELLYRFGLFEAQGSGVGVGALVGSPIDDLIGMIRQHYRDNPWLKKAACVGLLDDEHFFPNGQGHRPAATEVCQGCPVRQECEDYAVTTGQQFGMWGGTPERQLRKKITEHRRGVA